MRSLLSTPIRREFFFLIFLPFLLWMACFWGFLTGRLFYDPMGVGSYYEQTMFFVNNLIRGVYPLWDPIYNDGSPYQFFLRRIGDGNPFYLIIALFKLCGMTDLHAYRCFLGGYYFMAVVGFWMTCRLFLRDRLAYAGAFWIFLFSGWGLRLFTDYIILLLVPLVWFFYFLFSFFIEGKKHQFLGVFFTTAILMTTYIPSFFLTVICVFLFLFLVFFYRELILFLQKTFAFLKENKLFSAGCLVFLFIVLAPSVDFFRESKNGEFVMPGRNVGTVETSALALNMEHVKVGDVMAQGYLERTFEDHKNLNGFDFFVTYFFFLVLILSLVNPLTRRAVFLLGNIFLIGIISVTDATPVYKFLYDHVFFFRYMRMVAFLFWIALFPMAVFFAMEQMDLFLDRYRGKRPPLIIAFAIISHLLFAVWALRQEGVAWTSWAAIMASLLFFMAILMGYRHNKVLLGVLFFAVVVQPVEFCYHIARNAGSNTVEKTRFDLLADGKFRFGKKVFLQEDDSARSAGIYCGTRWFQDVSTAVPINDINALTAHKLYWVDNTAVYPKALSNRIFLELGVLWRGRKNLVLLPDGEVEPRDVRLLQSAGPSAEVIDENTSSVRVVKFDVNTLRLHTKLDRSRFLLWADNYQKGWHVYINGKEARLLRADYAFKGVWLPSGEADVLFRFATPFRYAGGFFVLFVFAGGLAILILLARREGLAWDSRRPNVL